VKSEISQVRNFASQKFRLTPAIHTSIKPDNSYEWS